LIGHGEGGGGCVGVRGCTRECDGGFEGSVHCASVVWCGNDGEGGIDQSYSSPGLLISCQQRERCPSTRSDGSPLSDLAERLAAVVPNGNISLVAMVLHAGRRTLPRSNTAEERCGTVESLDEAATGGPTSCQCSDRRRSRLLLFGGLPLVSAGD
jgi:hypothetical protein